MRTTDKRNQYADALGDLFDAAPKSVIAAVAVSLLTNAGEQLELARHRFLDEWRVLHSNGIVPQAPPRPRHRQTVRA